MRGWTETSEDWIYHATVICENFHRRIWQQIKDQPVIQQFFSPRLPDCPYPPFPKNSSRGRIIQLIKSFWSSVQVLGGLGRRMSSGDKASPSLTIDRAAFLLLRVKKAFRKKKQQRKEKRWVLLPPPFILFRRLARKYGGKQRVWKDGRVSGRSFEGPCHGSRSSWGTLHPGMKNRERRAGKSNVSGCSRELLPLSHLILLLRFSPSPAILRRTELRRLRSG